MAVFCRDHDVELSFNSIGHQMREVTRRTANTPPFTIPGLEELRLMIVIGIISDTHGLLRPEAVEALRGSAHILHAGDIGSPEILEELRKIAPVTAVSCTVTTLL